MSIEAIKNDLKMWRLGNADIDTSDLVYRAIAMHDALKAESERLKPYETELLRLAAVVGEENDPFAAWESIEPVLMQVDLAKTRAEAAEAECKRMREALEPFAKAAEIKLCGEWRDDERFSQTDVGFHLNFGHLRRAREALTAAPSEVKP